MLLDWKSRAALEARMRGPAFAAASQALAFALVGRTLEPLREGAAACTADDFAFATRCHGVAGRLRLLDQRDPGRLSPALSAALDEEATRIAARGRRLHADLAAIGAAARAEGLALVPLKGTALRLTHYPDPSIRPSADIDLLIRPADRDRWAAILNGLGYTLRVDELRHVIFLVPGHTPVTVDGDHENHPRPVELHEVLGETVFGRPIDITAMYLDRLSAHTGGETGPVHVPDEAALATYLLLHAAPAMLDRGLRLAQVMDFEVIGDDPQVIALARETLGPAAWAVAALLARDVPGLLSPAWLETLADVAPGRVLRTVTLRRPGLLRGDPNRLGTLTGELLLTGSPVRVVRRVTRGLASRARLRAPRPVAP
jgi:hypothetical protein